MSEIECPYCGYSYEISDFIETYEWREECEQCHKKYDVFVEFDPIFNIWKVEKDEQN